MSDHLELGWENIAKDALQSSEDFNHAQLICKYLFPDKEKLCTILSKRSKSWLASFSNFLLKHDSRHHYPSPAKGKKLHLVRNIMDLCHPKTTSDPHWNVESIVSCIERHLEPHAIAEIIDHKSWNAFTRIPYTAWVWFALGYKDIATRCFLDTLNELRDHVSTTRIFGLKERLVMEALEVRNPTAYWVLSTSYHGMDSVDARDAVQSFLDPIFDIANQQLDPVSLVTRLEILNLRFRRKYIEAIDITWSEYLSTDFSFLDSLESKDPKAIARSLTEIDYLSFGRLFNPDGPESKHIGTEWAELSYDVMDCITVYRRYISSIVEITMYLLSWWNFNSATSLIYGLRGPKFPFDLLPQFQKMFDLVANYEGYWIYQSRYPGIPCMFSLKKALAIKEHASIIKAQEKADMFPISSWISNVQERVETGEMDGTLVDTLKQWKEKDQEMNANGRVFHLSSRTW